MLGAEKKIAEKPPNIYHSPASDPLQNIDQTVS
jgi:hypothetical protein